MKDIDRAGVVFHGVFIVEHLPEPDFPAIAPWPASALRALVLIRGVSHGVGAHACDQMIVLFEQAVDVA